MFAFIEQLG